MWKSVAMVHLSKKSYKNTRTIIKPSGIFFTGRFFFAFSVLLAEAARKHD